MEGVVGDDRSDNNGGIWDGVGCTLTIQSVIATVVGDVF